MNKRIKLSFIIMGFLLCFGGYANAEKKYITSTDITDGKTVIGKVETTVFIKDIDENTMRLTISKTIDPFSQILQIEIQMLKGKSIYNFNSIDNWGNDVYGNIKFVEDSIEVYLDCENFSESGNNYARFYGDTEKLTLNKN